MVVRLVAKVKLSDLSSTVLYPRAQVEEERIALLTGIIQLVSAALERSGTPDKSIKVPRFMKSDKGVIGYCGMDGQVIICEGDTEHETDDALKAALASPNATPEQLKSRIERAAQTRGKEIGNLWR
jgi:hypothetical protein